MARARLAPIRTGHEQYVGKVALVHTDLTPRGRVWFDSQFWYAEVRPAQKVSAGQIVRIIGIEGLTLIVEPTEQALVEEAQSEKMQTEATGHRPATEESVSLSS